MVSDPRCAVYERDITVPCPKCDTVNEVIRVHGTAQQGRSIIRSIGHWNIVVVEYFDVPCEGLACEGT